MHISTTAHSKGLVSGIVLALIGAILFSAKAVLAKMIYRIYPIPVVSVLTMRMLLSLPFYLIIFFINWHRYKKDHPNPVESSANIRFALGIGILGYYLSSFLDFSGLKYVTAGLERIILFTYPTFVLLFAALFYKTPITPHQLLALVLAYAGVTVAFVSDLATQTNDHTALGSFLVLGCAITYGLYVLWSGRVIPKLGAPLFTSIAMMSATAAIVVHFLLVNHGFSSLKGMPDQVYIYLLLMAIFTTVIPSLAISAALKRIGSSHVAIISAVGPLATIFQAHIFLGESFGGLQILGTALVVAGVLIIGRKVKKGEPA